MQQNPAADGGQKLTLASLQETIGRLSAEELARDLDLVELAAGEMLFAQGDEADSMYIVVAGVLTVAVRNADGSHHEVDRLAPGAIVGEMGLLTGQPRTATVRALTSAGLLRVTRSGFEELRRDTASAEVLSDKTATRWQRLQLDRALRNVFGEQELTALHTLQQRIDWLHVSNGDVVFRQGDPSDGMYLVVSGRLRVVHHDPDDPTAGPQTLTEIGAGEIVGEYGLLTDAPRSASLYAVRHSVLARVTPTLFEQLVKENPELMGRVARVIVQRQQRQLQGQPARQTGALTLTIVPHSDAVDANAFTRSLTEQLTPYGSTLTLDQQSFEQRYGQEGAAQTPLDDPLSGAITAWLDQHEAEHQFLIFTATQADSAWTRRCVSQSDRILLLAHPNDDVSPGPVEAYLAQLEVPLHTELALWHPPGSSQPEGTVAWLAARQESGRPLAAHHHVRQGDGAHLGRLARRLSGHAVGLVLSGGGALGLAHLGIYGAFRELEIPIDYYGGTSMGALIAAVLASGQYSYDEALELAGKFSDRGQILDYTLPLTSLYASRKVSRLCQRLLGERQIEDLWTPFFCVSTNLSRAEPVVHQQGTLWRAVRASLAVPGIFTPVVEDGELLVDGGPMDNFPVGVMADLLESDRVIGVQFAAKRGGKRQFGFDTSLSGWRLLLSRLNPFGRALRAPSLAGLLLQAMIVHSEYRAHAQEAVASLVIRPDVSRFGFLEFDRYKELAEAGHTAALDALAPWKAEQAGL
ncbi:MAG: cyclic nucleotide-binding domain-containing protein [Candidatus Promineifilaceae bacterium]|nr:cyclic nucleotide-binding domain-containing protein [Candidatus Promineifilaceae bacterium]